MAYRLPRGTRDRLQEEADLYRRMEAVAVELSKLCGYSEISTPIFEHSELFERGVGEATDIVEKEMYSFTDRGGRNLTLRPEGTAPVVRAFVEHKLYNESMPARFFYWGPMFRYERPQAGRLRQLTQYGVELFGADSPQAEVEVIKLGWDYFRRLGVETKLVLNSIGCPGDRKRYRKILIDYLKQCNLCDHCLNRIERNPLRVLDCKNPACQEQLAEAPLLGEHLCAQCRQHFARVRQGLKALNIPYALDRRLVRGLDYYTRTTFEYKTDQLGAQDALGGGGRYDGLVELLGGPSLPAVGFSLGIDRTALLIRKAPAGDRRQGIWLVTMEPAAAKAISLAYALRDLGVRIQFDLVGRSVKAQFKQADRSNCRWAMVIGPDELAAGRIQLRDLASGQQHELRLDDIEQHILGLEGVKQRGEKQ